MLKIVDLQKNFGSFQALNHLNLEIAKGELFGFVGPNGAGKTTTMKIISGLMRADGGFVTIDGIDALHNSRKLKEKIGYMPDFFGVYDNLKAYEYMEFYASVYGILGNDARKLCNDLLDLVNLTDKADSYVDSLSRGMKQRLCLARSLVHNPELLILDEPASGLDPRARFEMKEILRNLCSMGKTIIEHGSMMAYGTVDEIQDTLKTTKPVIIHIADNSYMETALKQMKENPSVKNLSVQDNTISLVLKEGMDNTNTLAALLSCLVLAHVPVCSFYQEEGNLESLFMQITASEEN